MVCTGKVNSALKLNRGGQAILTFRSILLSKQMGEKYLS